MDRVVLEEYLRIRYYVLCIKERAALHTSKPLPQTVPHVIIEDEAFPLKRNLLGPMRERILEQMHKYHLRAELAEYLKSVLVYSHSNFGSFSKLQKTLIK
jgi:hypothetical protein